MTTTPFLELAKQINADIDNTYRCCTDLPKNVVPWFTEMFKPTLEERVQYRMDPNVWLMTWDLRIPNIGDNQFRILILLLAHEVWLGENNNSKK